jgi:hypothetical protein
MSMSESKNVRYFQATFDWDDGARDRFWVEATNDSIDKEHIGNIVQALAYPNLSNEKPPTRIANIDVQEIGCDQILESKKLTQAIADAAFSSDVRIIASERGRSDAVGPHS